MRSFVLAALLLTIGVGALVLVGLNTLAGPYADGSVAEFETIHAVLNWGKYPAGLLLLWLGGRAVLWREYLGWKRVLLLWGPFALFCGACWLQYRVLQDARFDYLQRHGQEPGTGASAAWILFVCTLAFAVTGLNAWFLQRRQLRLTATGITRHA